MTGTYPVAGRWAGKCILLISPLLLCSCLTKHVENYAYGMPRKTFDNVTEI